LSIIQLGNGGIAFFQKLIPAGDKEVVVLIHGSAGSSADMHGMAKAMQAADITVLFVPDFARAW